MKSSVLLLPEDVRVVRTSELVALLEGQTQKQVAEFLGIGESTLSRFIKVHVTKRVVFS